MNEFVDRLKIRCCANGCSLEFFLLGTNANAIKLTETIDKLMRLRLHSPSVADFDLAQASAVWMKMRNRQSSLTHGSVRITIF